MTNVFEYTDFRAYLKSYYDQHKLADGGFSYAVMAERTRISSRGLLKLIMDGKRNLSSSNLHNLTIGLGLNKSETQYFSTMVQFNQSKNLEEKNKLFETMLKFPQMKRAFALRQEQHNFYSKWYFSVILELVLLKDAPTKRADFYAWAGKKLKNKVSAKEIEDACRQLETLGLLKENTDGRFVQSNQFVASGTGGVNFELQSFHRHMIAESIESFPKPVEEREFGGVTLAIRKSDLEKAKAYIREFKKKFNFDLSAGEGADTVYQLNVQFFELADGFSPSADSNQGLNSANDSTEDARVSDPNTNPQEIL